MPFPRVRFSVRRMILLVAILALVMAAIDQFRYGTPPTFVPSLIPIALAYAIAHYFSLLVLQGQYLAPLFSDPLGKGWNLIGLSHVDPVLNRLFFRRFLNEDLQSVPDIDLDFARDIREKLILQVYRRYGHDHAALVCSFATYHLRSAVRDLGKVLGLPAPAGTSSPSASKGGASR